MNNSINYKKNEKLQLNISSDDLYNILNEFIDNKVSIEGYQIYSVDYVRGKDAQSNTSLKYPHTFIFTLEKDEIGYYPIKKEE